jgi:hypothetical protein
MFQFVSPRLRGDFDFMFHIVRKHPSTAFKYASEPLRDNDILAKSAVSNYGGLLEYASERLKDDRDLVLVALKSRYALCSDVYLHASLRLRNDRDLLFSAFELSEARGPRRPGEIPDIYIFASAKLRSDQDVVFAVLAKDPTAVECVVPSLFACDAFVQRLMKTEIHPALIMLLKNNLRPFDETSQEGILKVIDMRNLRSDPQFMASYVDHAKSEMSADELDAMWALSSPEDQIMTEYQRVIDDARLKLNHLMAEGDIRKACISGDILDLEKARDLEKKYSPAKVGLVQDRLDDMV